MHSFTSVPNPFWNILKNQDVNCAKLSNIMDNVIQSRYTIFIYEDPCLILHRVSRLYKNKVRGLCQGIHNNPYRVILSSSLWQSHYKVHSYFFPIQSGNFYLMKNPPGFWCSCINCWQLGYFAIYSAMSPFKTFHKNTSLR